MSDYQGVPLAERDAKWTTRRALLIEELASEARARHPNASWAQLSARVMAEVDLRMLYERFGHEP
jgi:hypothetical protein